MANPGSISEDLPPPYSEALRDSPYNPSQENSSHLLHQTATEISTIINAENDPQNFIRYVSEPTQGNVFPEMFENPCPFCRNGEVIDRYTCLGVFLAVVLFPFGIICCCMLKEKVCSYCRIVFS